MQEKVDKVELQFPVINLSFMKLSLKVSHHENQ